MEVSPPWPGVQYYKGGSGSPPEPAEIVDVTGDHKDLQCPLHGLEFEDGSFYDLVLAALDDKEADVRDREDDSCMEQERERREDWDPQENK